MSKGKNRVEKCRRERPNHIPKNGKIWQVSETEK